MAAQLNSWLPSRRRSKFDEQRLTKRDALDWFPVDRAVLLGRSDRISLPAASKSFCQMVTRHTAISIVVASTIPLYFRSATVTPFVAIHPNKYD